MSSRYIPPKKRVEILIVEDRLPLVEGRRASLEQNCRSVTQIYRDHVFTQAKTSGDVGGMKGASAAFDNDMKNLSFFGKSGK